MHARSAIPRNTTKYEEILRNTKKYYENQMSKKINAQPGQKLKTLRVARPIGDTQKYYEILRNTKKYQKILRKSNEQEN